MCDRYVFFRQMAKHYASEEGLMATFMPKPFADKTGSGAHFNMSLFDKETGKNLFKCPREEDPRPEDSQHSPCQQHSLSRARPPAVSGRTTTPGEIPPQEVDHAAAQPQRATPRK